MADRARLICSVGDSDGERNNATALTGLTGPCSSKVTLSIRTASDTAKAFTSALVLGLKSGESRTDWMCDKVDSPACFKDDINPLL